MCSRADAPGRLRFAFEALDGVLVLGDASVQHLDGHAAMDADVLALVDGAHAAFADQPDDAVLAVDDFAGRQCHLPAVR